MATAVVLVPAYEPDEKLLHLIRDLDRHRVVVVDDGSGPGYADLFARAAGLGAEVVTLPVNRGKGHALRTGFAHLRDHHPGRDVVCADSDGQHRPEDVRAVADRLAASGADMVLGARRFTGGVPARSRFGNAATRLVFRAATGRTLRDTQTGLRGYPARMLGWLGTVGGDRFEYEVRLLLRAVREGLRIEEVEIATVYLAGNASSHFRPLRDSARIYRPLFAFTASSLLGFSIDAILFLVFAGTTGSVLVAAVAARLISATVNFTVNRCWIFGGGRARAPIVASTGRYALLALTVLAANVAMIESLAMLTGSVVAAKVLTEPTLFAAGFLAQRYVVFPRPARPVPPHRHADDDMGSRWPPRTASSPSAKVRRQLT
ncbi:Glycosyltransferase involved in cell wall bisynthesis [Micromonospora haikouensis]|uniref:Glycosyltransferase involved in cell wall bisynthesis n=1 Tax=Micromonospora haikouensis TaxID=686309 RepID=A0A1C4XQI9_9ACTN|nr:glycosyltransferase [Micromonospora haikouensis]SCF10733.1 Glycosyltransferase involved in cell wall bisynthesis [Micromonospora haikouensis]